MTDSLLSDFDFELPEDSIAQSPPIERGASRLLVLPRREGAIEHRSFRDLPSLLRPNDLLVFNDTKVIPARIELRRATGGRVRGLLLDPPRAGSFRSLLEGKGRLQVGDVLSTPAGLPVRLLERLGGGAWRLEVEQAAALEILERGRMPLPPYIARADGEDPRDALDRERYQTVFAREPGAVAAPTAGLHFDEALLERLREFGVERAFTTLHVGLGTFQPVRVEVLAEHVMHFERYEVPRATTESIARARTRGGRVIAVGTTVVRSLESWACAGSPPEIVGDTNLFIRPGTGFEFRVVDAMITNFHLPKSTLLMLVSTFAGRERILAAYQEAVALGYRFFSYGDAMFIG